ncbi:F-box domain-containing protein [Stachybotrys elegans]|uniref:F-box domain-containing protein n=1 Tax=Stachybotrys elegans TaxID=80388 RepID=A0A8K0SLV0_9HYPO|nr:F-box domain-containing protein [Stachybotrys elegans]
MASTSARTHASRPSLNDLSTELIVLFCEWLRDAHYPSLLTLRRLSRRFNSIATPIAYRTLPVSRALADPAADRTFPSAFRHISLYTNHVIVHGQLPPDGVRRILARVPKLLSVEWRYDELEADSQRHYSLSGVLDLEQARAIGTSVSIHGLPLRDFTKRQADAYLNSVPASCLASLTLAIPAPSLTARLGSLRRLLVQSTNLETFRYDDRGQGTSFMFEHGEKLPAFKDLTLKCYDWVHSTEDVKAHWNFSRLQTLRLLSVPTFNFFRSVAFPDFSGLHTLQVDDYSAHHVDRRVDATKGMYVLVKEHIRALRVLDIVCYIEHFPLDAIARHRNSLQVLRIRDHVGFGDENKRCPTIDAYDLAQLAKYMVQVHTLEVDMDIEMCNPLDFIRAIAHFRNLSDVTIRVQTLLDAYGTDQSRVDKDFEAAMHIFQLLIRNRAPGRPWKRITVNVGDWQRNMVRRLSTSWRERNEAGVFAERCFVIERNQRERYTIREEGTEQVLGEL